MNVNTWVKQKYADILKMSQRISKSADYEELAHYCIEQFLNHERKEELIQKGQGMLFLSGIMWRSFNSNTSPYYTLYHQKGRVHELYDKTANQLLDTEYDFETDYKLEMIEGILEEMLISDVEEWYRATLFKLWIQEKNYSKISRQTNIPRTSISNAVNECIEYIKTEIKKRKLND